MNLMSTKNKQKNSSTMDPQYSYKYKPISDTCNSVNNKSQHLYALCSSPSSKIQSKLLMNSPNFAAATEFQFVLDDQAATNSDTMKSLNSTIVPLLTSIKNYFSNMLKPGVNQELSTGNILDKNADFNKFSSIGADYKNKFLLDALDYTAISSLLDHEDHRLPIELLTNCIVGVDKDLSILSCDDKKALKCVEVAASIFKNTQFEKESEIKKDSLDSFEIINIPDIAKPEEQQKMGQRKHKGRKSNSRRCSKLANGFGEEMNNTPPNTSVQPKQQINSSPIIQRQNTSWTFLESCLGNQRDWIVLPTDNFSFELNRSRSCDYIPSTFDCNKQRCISDSSDDFISFELDSDIDDADNVSKININTSGYDSDSDRSDDESDSNEKKVRFNMKPEVHMIHTWNFAYRQARKGTWEQMALDRCRFEDRIRSLKNTISPILSPEHRSKIFNERFKSIL